ncbi:MAG: PEP-CTERM system TPR-repeat protein PrsT [Gammaproteobacteria bacterium]|nr:PEP-CTERM system TPR-repeat protein PrsT [Gammaproteobacteria bacterium]MBQ0838615.1 PEP-CTERM system TPR-repeat protein PrsT [Gammaproteobacteria bacterium]
MKRIYRVIAIMFVGCVLLACSESTTSTEYLKNAKRYLNDGEPTAATIELKNALKNDGNNAEARWLLGKIYFDLDDMPGADKELRHARQLGYSNDEVLPLLAQAMLGQAKLEELLALPAETLAADSLATLLSAQGLAKLAEGEVEAAGELIDAAVGAAPQLAYAQMAKARLLLVGGDVALVRSQLDIVFAVDPNYAPALSLLGDLELQQNKLEAAQQAYTRAIDAGTTSSAEFADRLKRALVLVALKKYDAAQTDVSYLLARAAKHPSAHYVQGLIYFQQKKVAEARVSFDQALPAKERHPQVLYYLAALHLLEGNREQATAYASEFYAIAPGNIAGRKLLATIRLDERDYPQVEELLRPVLALAQNDAGAMNLLANALMRQGKTDEAIDLLSEVAELEPASPQAQMRLGAGMLASGEQAGVEYIESALRLNPDNQQGEVLLVLNYLRQNKLDEALQAAEAYRDRQPDIATAHNLVGRVHMAAKRINKAQEAFQKAREVAPGDPFASQNLALFAIQDKQYGAAEGFYQEILEHHEGYLPALLKLAALRQLQGDEAAVIGYLERAMEANPAAYQPRLVLARLYLTKGRADKVAILLSGLEGASENPEILHVAGLAQLAEKDYHSARVSFEKLLQIKPDAAAGHYLLAQAYDGLGRHKDVESGLRKAIELAPDYIEPRVALARLSLKQGNNKAFAKQLAKLETLAPQSPVIWQLQIARARLKGDEQAVLAIYENAFGQLPSTATMLGLAGQKLSRGDTKGAGDLYQRWVVDNPEDVAARMALANLHIQEDDTALAIAQYQRVLSYEANHLVALNNLAWFLRDSNSQQALEYARRAVKIDGEAAAVQDTLAMALLADGQHKEAKNAIAKALGKTPDNSSMRYHRVLINLAAGQKSSAVSELRRLLKSGDKFPERQEAEALMQEFSSEVQ